MISSSSPIWIVSKFRTSLFAFYRCGRYTTTPSNGNISRVTGPLWGKPPVSVGSPSQRPVTRSFDIFFDLYLNNRLSKIGDAGDLRRNSAHSDATVMKQHFISGGLDDIHRIFWHSFNELNDQDDVIFVMTLKKYKYTYLTWQILIPIYSIYCVTKNYFAIFHFWNGGQYFTILPTGKYFTLVHVGQYFGQRPSVPCVTNL